MWERLTIWALAARPRTIPLAVCSITMGAILAAEDFSWATYALALLTAILLQILSNLANDYGDAAHGADGPSRIGPQRAVQAGRIAPHTMKRSLALVASLALVSGVALLRIALPSDPLGMAFFLLLGGLSILAALAYTTGKRPYGYAGLGDVAVFLFFGPIGVLGALYLFSQRLTWPHLWPAISCGALSTAVLNVNNIRDIVSDKAAGKRSIPVRIGRKKAVFYHWALLSIGFLSASAYIAMHYRSAAHWFFLLSLPFIVANGAFVYLRAQRELDRVLRHTVLTVLVFVFSFGVGMLG